MRLNQSMRDRLQHIVMANTEFPKHSDEAIQKAFIKAEKKLLPKEIKVAAEKYPQFFIKFFVNFWVHSKAILTKEEQEEFTHSTSIYINVEGTPEMKERNNSCYYQTYLNMDFIISWFKDYPELEFVQLIKENLISDLKEENMRRELSSFLDTCTTDKQILLTFPEFEKYFNEAGIVPPAGGTTLPVPTTLTNLVKSHLK